MTNPKTLACALTVLLSASALVAQHGAPAHGPGYVGKTVPLTPGNCAQIADGDSVTLEWNPAFDNPAAVTGLWDMVLTFSRRGEEGGSRRGYAGIVLRAHPHISPDLDPFPDAVVAAPNGFYRIHFRVVTRDLKPGEYQLIDARADAQTPPGYDGKKPEMTNSPLGSAFCLTVAAPAAAPALPAAAPAP